MSKIIKALTLVDKAFPKEEWKRRFVNPNIFLDEINGNRWIEINLSTFKRVGYDLRQIDIDKLNDIEKEVFPENFEHKPNYVFIDIETTGLNELTEDITQICIVVTDHNFKLKKEFNAYYQSDKADQTFESNGIVQKISDLTGLTEVFLKENGKPIKAKDDEMLKQFIKENVLGNIYVAYNAQFEDKWLRHHGILNTTWYCPKQTLSNYYQRMSIKESDMLNLMKVEYDPNRLHNAMYDVRMMIEAIKKMVASKSLPEWPNSEEPVTQQQKLYNSTAKSKYDAWINSTKCNKNYYKKQYMQILTKSVWR